MCATFHFDSAFMASRLETAPNANGSRSCSPAPYALAVAGESDEWPNRTPSFRLGVGLMDKLPGDVWHATGHLDWVLLATLALGFGVQKWARVPI